MQVYQNSTILSALVITFMLTSLIAIDNNSGYAVLLESVMGRFICIVCIMLLTILNKVFGLFGILLYMMLYCNYIANRYNSGQSQYLGMEAFSLQDTADSFNKILFDSKNFDVPEEKPNNELFLVNKDVLDKKINIENLVTRNTLSQHIDFTPPTLLQKNKILPFEEGLKLHAFESDDN
jgi:hypothetical protein